MRIMVKCNLKKTNWSESKKETKLVALRDKKRKNLHKLNLWAQNFKKILKIC